LSKIKFFIFLGNRMWPISS